MDYIKILQTGGIGVMATDTVYGVVAKLDCEEAVNRIYDVKLRDATKPVGTILISDIDQLHTISDPGLIEIAQQYWPGPTSVILPVDERYSYTHKGIGSLAFRIPDNDEIRSLVRQTGPLATSSANIQGEPPAESIEQAKKYFGDTVDFYVDAGDIAGGKPSRIIEIFADGTERIIRN